MATILLDDIMVMLQIIGAGIQRNAFLQEELPSINTLRGRLNNLVELAQKEIKALEASKLSQQVQPTPQPGPSSLQPLLQPPPQQTPWYPQQPLQTQQGPSSFPTYTQPQQPLVYNQTPQGFQGYNQPQQGPLSLPTYNQPQQPQSSQTPSQGFGSIPAGLLQMLGSQQGPQGLHGTQGYPNRNLYPIVEELAEERKQ